MNVENQVEPYEPEDDGSSSAGNPEKSAKRWRHARYYRPVPSESPVRMRPARGETILTLGILSLLGFGLILGPIAWIMGTTSLFFIDRGRSDPDQRNLVVAGRICGVISTIGSYLLLACIASGI